MNAIKKWQKNKLFSMSFWFMRYSLFYLIIKEIARPPRFKTSYNYKKDKKCDMNTFFCITSNVVRSLWASETKQLWWAFLQRHDTEFLSSIIYLSNLFYRFFLWWRWQRPNSIIWFTFSIKCWVLSALLLKVSMAIVYILFHRICTLYIFCSIYLT